MTHIFEVGTNFFNLVNSDQLTFDILNFGPKVSVGDTIIYQRLCDTEDEETDDEVSVKIEYIFDDAEKCLKKGFTAFGFKLKEA